MQTIFETFRNYIKTETKPVAIAKTAQDFGISFNDLLNKLGKERFSVGLLRAICEDFDKVSTRADIPDVLGHLSWSVRSIEDAWSRLDKLSKMTVADFSAESEEEQEEELNEFAYEPEGDYHYNKLEDLYLVFVKHRRRPLQVPGDVFRGMKEAYSNMSPGGAETINQICKTYSISRKDFMGIKIACGWTKTDDPYTDEEHLEEDTDKLVTSLVMKKRHDFERQFRKKEWRLVEEEAKRWRELVHISNNKFDVDVKKIKEFLERTRDLKQYVDGNNINVIEPGEATSIFSHNKRKNTLIIPVSDIHYGKLVEASSSSRAFNTNVADERLAKAMGLVESQTQSFRDEVGTVIYASLGDNFEALMGNMRDGQLMSMDSYGFKQYLKVIEFHVSFIKHIHNLFPNAQICCPFIPGNHDRLTKDKSWNSEVILNAITTDRIAREFESDPKYSNIKFEVSDVVSSIVLPNNVNLLLQHGHIGKKPTSANMQNYIKVHGTKSAKRYIVGQGHFHSFECLSGSDYKFFTNPAFCGADDYAVFNLTEKSPSEFVMVLSSEEDDVFIGPFKLE